MEAPMQEGGRAPGMGAHRDGQEEKDEEGVSREGVAGGGFLFGGQSAALQPLARRELLGASGRDERGVMDAAGIRLVARRTYATSGMDEAPSSSMHCSPWRPCIALLVLPLHLAMLSPALLLALMGSFVVSVRVLLQNVSLTR